MATGHQNDRTRGEEGSDAQCNESGIKKELKAKRALRPTETHIMANGSLAESKVKLKGLPASPKDGDLEHHDNRPVQLSWP